VGAIYNDGSNRLAEQEDSMGDPFADVKTYFGKDKNVIVNSGKGAQGLKLGKKMFVMFFKGQLIVMLSPERVNELIESGEALPHDPGTGKPMKNRVLVTESNKAKWIQYCEESKRYMDSLNA
jgi:hypothetical protein